MYENRYFCEYFITMSLKSFFTLLLIGCFVWAIPQVQAQQQSTDTSTAVTELPAPAKYKISLITCGPGEELYATFGHTAIRIQNLQNGLDEVYNYGMFNFRDSLFYVKFTLGKLDYYIAKEPYNYFIQSYIRDERKVQEQQIQLSDTAIIAIRKYLENNLLPQNRAYKYDFVHDNCATRIRDVFQNSLGTDFYFFNVIGTKKVSYRSIINEYLAQNKWPRLGINILLGSKIDSLMTNEGAMFLPDVLHNAMAQAKFQTKPMVQQEIILNEGASIAPEPNWPLYTSLIFLVITFLIFNIKALKPLKNLWARLHLLVFGLIGILILFMWLVTDHQSCDSNYNILWAVPTHVIVAFLNYKGKPWARLYSLIAISLTIVALLVHIIGIQVMPLIELLPWFIILMMSYLHIYQESNQKNASPKNNG